MKSGSLQIQRLELRTARESEYAALNAFANRMRAERFPDDPPLTLADDIANWQHPPALIVASDWLAWDEGTVVARGHAHFMEVPENRHLMDFRLDVVPELRRQGLAKRLLPLVIEFADANQRTLLMCATSSHGADGAAFMERVGARRGLDLRISQLALAEVDRSLNDRWLASAPTQDFELGLWEGPVPDHELAAVCRLIEVLNTAPRGELEMEDFHVTPEQLRSWERADQLRGNVTWTVYTRQRATGEFAGFTDVVWNPLRPWLVQQRGTGTFPQFRGRGLGRWMKAAMLDRILRERPEVRFIRTDNAESNAAMLKINVEMGFKPHSHELLWQVGAETVRSYLER